jgi:site-specific DNA-adenine methylase
MTTPDMQASLAMVADALKKVMNKFNETINRLDEMDKRVRKIEDAESQKRILDLEHRMEYAETLVLADEDAFASETAVIGDIRSGRYRPFDRSN